MAFKQFAQRAVVLVGSGAFAAGAFQTVALADKAEEAARNNLFDPEAYERAAKAVREINKSPYAKQVCKLMI
jgi:ATPase family AAA domain-containing protein 3A/B